MGKKLYVGNLPFSMTDQDLEEVFTQVGQVISAKIIMDRMSGRSKGFGFVEMSSDVEAQGAIAQFNGADLNGRPITVNEARPMAPRTFTGAPMSGNRNPMGNMGNHRQNRNQRWS